jgi:hypothetical protein
LYFVPSGSVLGDYAVRLDDNIGTLVTSSMHSVLTDRWVCVELATHLGPAGSAEVFIDGSSWLQSPINTTPSPPFGLELVGLYQPKLLSLPAFDVWIDEVVFDSSPIGCTTK